MSNNNLDDFEDTPPTLENENFEEPQEQRSRISETLKTNPAFKIFLILIAGGALASAALGIFSGDNERTAASIVGQTGDLTSTPGGQASPAFQQAVVEASRQRASSAVQGGGSALPTPLGGQTQITTLDPDAVNPNDDPLAEFRAEEVKPTPAAALEPPAGNYAPPPQPGSYQQFQQQQPPQQQQVVDNTLTQAMQAQMQTMIAAWQPSASRVLTVTPPRDIEQPQMPSQPSTAPYGMGEMLVPAGTINYGQMMIEANSDVPGPIMAQIMSGPLAGGRAIGTFQVQQDYLVMQFNMVSLDGIDYPVQILALNPDTTLGGMATEVDQRYWSRVILPAAADFVSGFANSFAQADQQVTVQDGVVISSRAGASVRRGIGEGAAKAGDRLSDILDERGNQIRALVRVAAGTPIGLFFVSSVYEPQENAGEAMYSSPYGGMGYPGIGNTMGYGGGSMPYSTMGQIGGGYVPGQNLTQGGYNTGFNSAGTGYNSTSGYTGLPGTSGMSMYQTGTGRQPVYINGQ
ncbi:MAG: hypothetical protein AB7G06_05250 [Bdellovibrionales bacterium]